MSTTDSHLDNRLKLCADFVRQGSKLADIGTDHAYLPVWLCRNGICPAAIAADINPEPLKRGRQTVVYANLCDRIETRLSDGLRNIRADEADDIVIAGMGGELIAKIMSECDFAKDSGKRFILQPMTKSELLLEWLCKNGFNIINQDCCVAADKCYTVLSVGYTGADLNKDRLFYYTGKLTPHASDTHRRFIEAHIARLRKKAKGDAQYDVLADRLAQWMEDQS